MTERGFSLVEVIIAMVILTVGILGLAASTSAITRMTAEGGRSGSAARVAQTRFEGLRAAAIVNCATVVAGTASGSRYAERWSVTTSGYVRVVTDSVSYNTGRATRYAVYSTNISCAPEAK